jgi:inner membrane protein
MNPITHILSGWALAELSVPKLTWREKTLITSAAVLPDIDGLGLIAELATRDSSRPLLWWTEYHHVLGHNLMFAVAVAFLAFVMAAHASRKLVAVFALVAVHLHIVGDLVGSRGPDNYQWPIPYLYPFTDAVQLTWSGQWYLNAWPNILITIVLLALTASTAWRRGYSIVGIVSARANEAFVQVLRSRFGQP